MNKDFQLDALIASGRLSIIPVGFNEEGEREKKREGEREQEGESAGGYTTRFTGAYVCYTCGHLCECGESESD
jgi:hypothetical protein